MTFKVEIADSAKAELDEIVRYFVEKLSNPVSARKLLDDFYEQKSFLYDNPYMFPLCPIQVLQRKGYRRFLFMKNDVALYLVEDEEDKKVVTIMHVFLDAMGISAYRLAKEISVPETRISEIVHGKRSITADTAIRFSKFFGTTAEFWLNLQNLYDLEEEKNNHAPEFENIKMYAYA